jgi:uncharacterized DUF497 family protein
MGRKIYVWNSSNVRHIAKHSVSTEEAEYVTDHARRPYPKRIGDRKYLVRGRTRQNRYLQVIFIRLGDEEVDVELLDLVERIMFESGNEVLYVIHARDFNSPRRSR